MSEAETARFRFPSTHWSEVERAATETSSGDREALARLLQRYLPALRAHLLAIRRVHRDEVDDLLQGFVTDRIIAGEVLNRADRDRGRFRTFLLRVLNNYVANVNRDQRTQQRGGGQKPTPIDLTDASVRDARAAGHDFEVAWGVTILNEVLSRMEKECRASGQVHIWEVFDARLVKPSFECEDPVPYNELVARFDFASPTQAGNVLVTGKRMFIRLMREVVAEYCPTENSVDDEISALRAIFSSDGA